MDLNNILNNDPEPYAGNDSSGLGGNGGNGGNGENGGGESSNNRADLPKGKSCPNCGLSETQRRAIRAEAERVSLIPDRSPEKAYNFTERQEATIYRHIMKELEITYAARGMPLDNHVIYQHCKSFYSLRPRVIGTAVLLRYF